MRRILIALLCGALLGGILCAAPAAATPAPNATGMSIGFGIFYRLPAGTKLEFFYVHGSGHCLEPLRPDRVRFDLAVDKNEGRVRPFTLFTTEASDTAFDSCRNGNSYATWQLRVTTPTETVRTGSLYFAATGGSASVTCHDFAGFTCLGDAVRTTNANATLEVTLGPVTSGSGPSLPFGSS